VTRLILSSINMDALLRCLAAGEVAPAPKVPKSLAESDTRAAGVLHR
jgi:hypothetical protein